MSAEPRYPFETIGYGETLLVAPGVHWLRMPLPFALDHINLYLLEDEDGWTVVDTGWNGEDVRELWRAAMAGAMGGRPIRRAIVTHFHPDHLGLAGWLEAEHAVPLWMTYGEWLQAHLAWTQDVTHDAEAWMAFFRDNGLDEPSLDAYRAGLGDFGRWTSPVPRQVRRIWDGARLRIGGRDWRVIVGGGHSPEHAALYCEQLEVLISGDQVLPRITTNISVWFTDPDGDPLRQFLESFERFRPLAAGTLVLPSHNRPFYGLGDRLDALAAHHRDRLETAFAFCTAPRTARDLVPVLFKRALDGHQMGFAMGEALAHLNYLVADGRLAKTRDADGVIRYRQT